tara:strand:- start:95 stop:715 length:621 start_codon:yes stop_codon:yes gene_type:complete
MTLGITTTQSAQNNSLLGGGYTNGMATSDPYSSQMPTNTNPFMAGMLGGAGINQQYVQQPLTPPSETQILASMLNTIQPIDRFFISQSMPIFVEMVSNIAAFSILNVLKNSTFKIDDDGNMNLDLQSLPSDLQTLSAENIIAQLNNLQNISQNNVNNALQERANIIALSEQSVLQTALTSALSDSTMMESIGSAAGTTARSLFGFR